MVLREHLLQAQQGFYNKGVEIHVFKTGEVPLLLSMSTFKLLSKWQEILKVLYYGWSLVNQLMKHLPGISGQTPERQWESVASGLLPGSPTESKELIQNMLKPPILLHSCDALLTPDQTEQVSIS